MLWLYPSASRLVSNESLTSLKRYAKFSHFHVITRKKLAFDLKLHSFGLSLMLLQDSLKWWNSKFGHNVTIQETMVTKQTDIYSNNVYASWWVWHENSQKGTSLDLKIIDWRMTFLCKWPFLLLSPLTQVIYHLHIVGTLFLQRCKVCKPWPALCRETGLREWSWYTNRSMHSNRLLMSQRSHMNTDLLEPSTTLSSGS